MGGGCSTAPLQAVLWDLDGTLIDTSRSSFNALLDILTEHLKKNKILLDIPAGELLPLIGNNSSVSGAQWQHKGDWAKVALEMCKLEKIVTPKQLIKQWEGVMLTRRAEIPLLPGALELVKHFKAAGIPQAIATMSSKKAVDSKRKINEELFSYMNLIVCGDDKEVKNRKPAPDIYLVAAARLNVSTANCVVIEDSPEGMRSGFAAGCKVVGVPGAWMNLKLIGRGVKCDYMIKSLEQFPCHKFGLKKLAVEKSGAKKYS
jgi:pseudouridine 5'-phosphatase